MSGAARGPEKKLGLAQALHDSTANVSAAPLAPAPADMARRRHYGLDWLRILAFALLILFHIALVFSPGHWVIKSPVTFGWLAWPMALLTPWRLSLLFAVSGYASAHLFAREGSPRAFARSRARRLLMPLAFGMVVLVPVEMWALVSSAGYTHGLGHFLLQDYWRSGIFYGHRFPSWEHLWFVAYLASYSFVLAALLAVPGQWFDRWMHRAAAWLGIGRRLLFVPVAVLAGVKLSLLFVVPEEQGLFTDWAGHALYMPMFLFGFALGRCPALWEPMRRQWKEALAMAMVAGIVYALIETHWDVPPHLMMAVDRAARVAMGWWMVLALFTIADRWWNIDHPWRRTLAEAVFPFYLIHHGVIILIAWRTLPLGWPSWVEFLVLLSGTGAACLLFYFVGREIAWLRPWIGLGPAPRAGTRPSVPAPPTPTAA